MPQKSLLRPLLFAALPLSLLLAPTDARADEVSSTAKGITGGALLGGEVVTIGMSLFNVHSGLAYGIGAIVGAGGGGTGGYFIERSSSDGRVPTYMLAGGLALLIPATVLVMNATRYQPAENTREDRAPTNSPAADPGQKGGSLVGPAGSVAPGSVGGSVSGGASGGSAPAPGSSAPASPSGGSSPGGQTPPLSLFQFHSGAALRLGVPVPEVRAVYSLAEQKTYGVPQQTEVRLPLLRGAF